MSTTGSNDGPDRAVSEMTAVATLVGLVIVLVVGIGLNVFLVAPSNPGPPDANFTYRHLTSANSLIITFSEGDEIKAGDLYVQGENRNVSWAQLANQSENATIKPGARVQASKSSAFGSPVRPRSEIRIIWRNASRNETSQLSQWTGRSGL